MCNSYGLPVGDQDWDEFFETRFPKDFKPKYSDSYPGNDVIAVREVEGEQLAEIRRWGLVPIWVKPEKLSEYTKGNMNRNNARGETMYENGIFRIAAGKGQRCLLPAKCFYEFTGAKGSKTKHTFTIPDRPIFCFAGLYDDWIHPEEPENVLHSCTLVTCDPSEEFKQWHHREPVIIPEGMEELWLDPETPKETLFEEIIKSSTFEFQIGS